MRGQQLVLGLLLLLGVACRSTKFQREQFSTDRQQSYAVWQNGQSEVFDFTDSTGRYWYLKTDSAFHYHPDSGLQGRQGVLALWESRVQREGRAMQADSSLIEARLEEAYSGWSRNISKWKANVPWWGLGAMFVFAGYWRFKRR